MNVLEPDVSDDAFTETVGGVIMDSIESMYSFVKNNNMKKIELYDDSYDIT